MRQVALKGGTSCRIGGKNLDLCLGKFPKHLQIWEQNQMSFNPNALGNIF